jgi:hypothetical protein
VARVHVCRCPNWGLSQVHRSGEDDDLVAVDTPDDSARPSGHTVTYEGCR